MSYAHGGRICNFEQAVGNGEGDSYTCPRDEFCCNMGCCISPSFQFYQLWYYWFMVLFMFLICSGGQWWYRIVMQGGCGSAMPPPARRTSYPRQCRVAYTPARDTVVLHHLWKPSYIGVNGPPPSYSQSGASGSNGPDGPKLSPYMQLYGPPPSYESVIGAGPAPIHHLSGSSSGSIGPDQSIQLTPHVDPQPAPIASSHHHHHRQGSSGGGNSSHQQSPPGSSAGILPIVGGSNQPTHSRRCTTSYSQQHHHQYHPHNHQHIQKFVVEPIREDSQSPQPAVRQKTTSVPTQPLNETSATAQPQPEVGTSGAGAPQSSLSEVGPGKETGVPASAIDDNLSPSSPSNPPAT